MYKCPLCESENCMGQEIDPRCLNCQRFTYDFDKEIGFCTEDDENPIPVDEVSCDFLEN